MTDLAEIPIFTSNSSSNGKQGGEKYQACRQHAPLIISTAFLASGQAPDPPYFLIYKLLS